MDFLPFALPDISRTEVAAVIECLESGWLTSGRKVQEFEAAFARTVKSGHAIAVNSATAGALLTLDALGVGPGTEVIVPAMTFSGPAMMAHRLGAKVVLADCEPDNSYQISVADVAAKITPQTRVVMPTHFGGASCSTAALSELCYQHGIKLVDDAAHAFPTIDRDTLNMVGSGRDTHATFFSFYATKCITTGEGGMVTTNNDELADKIKKLRLHGFNRTIFDRYTNVKTGWKYDIAAPGWKANMTDIAAAMGLAQLERADDMLIRRQTIAQFYRARLKGSGVVLPKSYYGHAWHLYPVQVDDRDRFVNHMAEVGVQCSVHFIPLSLHSYWQQALGVEAGHCPNAEAIYARSVSLPIFSKMTDKDVQRVVDAVLLFQERDFAQRS